MHFRHLVSGIVFLCAFAQSTWATTGLDQAESQQIAQALIKNASALGDHHKIVENAQISNDLLFPNAQTRICSILFSPFKYRTPKMKIAELLLTLPVLQQDFLRRTIIGGQSTDDAVLSQHLETHREKNSDVNTHDEITQIARPDFLPPISVAGFNPQKIVADVEQALKELASGTTGPKASKTEIQFLEFHTENGKVKFGYRLIYPNSEIQAFHSELESLNGMNPDDFLSDVIVSTINHRTILSREDRLRQEINMLAYNLKKLNRTGNSQVLPRIQAWINRLVSVKDGDFARNPTARMTALLRYLEVKKEVLLYSQLAQSSINSEQANLRNLAPTAENAAPARGTGPAVKVKFNAQSNNRFARANPGRVSGRLNRGYYSPNVRPARTESSTLNTLAWIMDPYYMMTHPWFWGVSDQSFMAPFMMMGMMQDLSERSVSRNSVFTPEAPYDARMFDRPVEPIFYQNPQQPVADPWNAPIRNDSVYFTPGEEGTPGSWQRADGKEVMVNSKTLETSWNDFVGDNRQAWGDPVVQTNDLPSTANGVGEAEGQWIPDESSGVTETEIDTNDFEEGDGQNDQVDDGSAS